MSDPLAEAFQSEIPCEKAVATLLASLAREHLARLGGGPEDSDADLIVRLRDPRVFGTFAEVVCADRRAGAAAQDAVLEHVFDLLPLPRSELELINVEARAPPRLLALALRLAESEGLSVLHVMHLVYAVFLDRSLVLNVPRATRSAVYRSVLGIRDASEDLRVLYACLHLSTVSEAEGVAEIHATMRSRSLPPSLRHSLASVAASEDGGRFALTVVAQREGLVPSELGEPQRATVLANIPRLPEKLAAPARKFLARGPPA